MACLCYHAVAVALTVDTCERLLVIGVDLVQPGRESCNMRVHLLACTPSGLGNLLLAQSSCHPKLPCPLADIHVCWSWTSQHPSPMSDSHAGSCLR